MNNIDDAFFLPRYDFHYRDGRTVKKASISKFAKTRAKQRFGRDDRRSQGSALQDAFYQYLRDDMQLHGVMPPERKKTTTKDRLEPEVFGLRKDRQKLQETSRRLVNADRVARQRIKGQIAENEARAQLIATKEAVLDAERNKMAAELSAFETSLAERSSAVDRKETTVRRDAKTVRNILILSGQGVSRSLNRIVDAAFESQDVR
jgi:hypothetical protein